MMYMPLMLGIAIITVAIMMMIEIYRSHVRLRNLLRFLLSKEKQSCIPMLTEHQCLMPIQADGQEVIMHLWVYLRPQAKITRKESNRLKDQIRKRLQREDYTCRLSDLPINIEGKLGFKWLDRRLAWLARKLFYDFTN